MQNQITQAVASLQQYRDAALGQIGAIASPIRDMMAVPSTLLTTARAWQNDFTTGRAADMVGTLNDFRTGGSLTDGWRTILAQADTVSEADILAVYPQDPIAGQRAVDAFRRRREAANQRVVLANTRADAAAALAEVVTDAETKADGIATRNNVGATALQQAILAGTLSEGTVGCSDGGSWKHGTPRPVRPRTTTPKLPAGSWRPNTSGCGLTWRRRGPRIARPWTPTAPSAWTRSMAAMRSTRSMGEPHGCRSKRSIVRPPSSSSSSCPGRRRYGRSSAFRQRRIFLIWLVLRPIVQRNQDTQIGNQVRELREMAAALQTATGQLTQVRAMAQGQIAAIASPIRDMIAVPSTLLDNARAWQNDFPTGAAADMVGTLNDFPGRRVADRRLAEHSGGPADTVFRGPDILAVYAQDPVAGQRAVDAFRRRRTAAEARLERTAARAVAAADIQALRAATAGTIETVRGRVDLDPRTGGPNLSGTALEEGDAITRIAQLRMLIGMGRGRAVGSQARAHDAAGEELARRELEAERQRVRTDLGAAWAQDRAALDANRAQRMDSLYGGFRLHPVFGGTP